MRRIRDIIRSVARALVGTSSLSGATTFGPPLPANSQLIGVRLVAQGIGSDSLVARGFAGSDGVLAVSGR